MKEVLFMDRSRRFFSILSEPAAVRFITRLLAALAAFEMLEVFFGCSFSLRLPLLLLLSALLLAGELSGRPFFGFFSCAVLTLSVSLLFMRLNSGDDTGVPESMLFAGGVFLLIGLLTAEEAGTHSPEDHAAHSAKRTRADSPEKPAVHSVKEPRANSPEEHTVQSTKESRSPSRGRAGSRVLTAVLLTGLLCGFLFDRPLSAVTTASVLVLVLFEILALVNPSAQKYFILLCILEALCFSFPRSADPFDWSFAVRAGQKALERIDYLFEDVRCRFPWTPGDSQSASYSGMGSFANPKGNENRVQLKINRKNTAGRTYFAGVHYTVPGNRGWTERADESLPGEDLINLAAALVRAGQSRENASVFTAPGHARIEYRYLHTRDVIRPEYTFTVSLADPSLIDSSPDTFRFRKTQGKGTYYDASWIDVDTGSDSFDRMIRLCEANAEMIPSYEELCSILNDLPDVKASEILSETEYSSWAVQNSEGPSPIYLDTDGTTERMRALAETITDSCGSNYEKCLAIESFLRQFPYNTKADYSKTENVTDAFLFDVQEGWCTQYASAMVLLLRLAGVPARYTEGFLCRYERREEGFYLVTGNAAHAWPEAWIPGYGWMRFEPTAGYYTRQEVSWAQEKTGADTEKGGSSADEDASGSANGISDIIPPPSGSDELLSSEDPSLFREKNVFLRITLTAAAFCPLYLALFLLLFRLVRWVRYKRASLRDRIRMQLEDIFCLIQKSYPGEWKNAPLQAYPDVLPEGRAKAELTRLIEAWYRIRYRGDPPDEALSALARSCAMSRKKDYLETKGLKKAIRCLDLLLRMKSPVGKVFRLLSKASQ